MSCKADVRQTFISKRHALTQERREEAKGAAAQILPEKLKAFPHVLSFASKAEEIDLWPLNEKLAQEGRLLFPRLIPSNELAWIFHEIQKNPHNLFPDSSKKLFWKGLKTFPARVCSALRKTFCTPFPRFREISRLVPFAVSDLEQQLILHPKWKVLEPHPEFCPPFPLDQISAVLVPGVAFDTHHHRLGYGKGYYDRFLAKLSCPFFGVGFKEQLATEPLPAEKHDISLTDLFLF